MLNHFKGNKKLTMHVYCPLPSLKYLLKLST